MENIKVLRQRKHDLRMRAEAILNEATGASRPLTATEQAESDQLLIKIKATGAEIAVVEAALDRERTAPAASRSPGGGLLAPCRSIPAKGGKIGARCAEIFGAAPPSNFESMEEFFATVHSGLFDPRLRAAMDESVPAEGGFAVPTEYAQQMLDASLEKEIVRPRAWVTPMTTETKKIVQFDMSDNSSDAPFGGLKLNWIAETKSDGPGNTLLGERSTLWMSQLTAKKGYLLSWVSNELIADGMTFEQALLHSFSEAMAWGLDVAFFTGSGAGQPLGILNDPALITIPKESGQAAATIIFTNLVKMFAQIHPMCVDDAIWIANNTAIPQLLTMVYPGTTYPLPSLVLGPDGKYTLLTRPVVFTEKVAPLGTTGDIMLVSLSHYAIGLRREISIDKSAHVGFLTDQSAYRAIVRLDGQGRWNKAYTPRKGNPLSWCIALANR